MNFQDLLQDEIRSNHLGQNSMMFDMKLNTDNNSPMVSYENNDTVITPASRLHSKELLSLDMDICGLRGSKYFKFS
jgi:hypothetical protein